ncbi:MAG: molybdopterin-dependent oxidoreductase, partial [Betaproteobacteria bacterium]|nr:molybdopterin-dependent oxidoreductase [Betaproteobacteria bacterium]
MNAPAAGGPKRPASLQKNPRLPQWLRIDRDGTVWITSGKVEIGQGILTALAQIAAEELDIDPGRIRMLAAATDRSPDEGVTSGSLSIQDSGSALRFACAQARALLFERAERQLGVPIAQLRIEDGTIYAANDSTRRTTYWDLAGDRLLDREIEGTPAAKPAREYRVVGSSAARLDLPDKIAGRPCFIQDMVLPGMRFGRVVRAPRGLAQLAALDRSALESMPGVVLVHEGSFAGVLAERE